MKKWILFSILGLMTSPMAFAAKAKDCSLAIYKTYMPTPSDEPACDQDGLPAEFSPEMVTVSAVLSKLGYQSEKYDQCKYGRQSKHAYSLVSQLGSCVQYFGTATCKLYVGLYDERTDKPLYEKTIQTKNSKEIDVSLLDAMKNLPACPAL